MAQSTPVPAPAVSVLLCTRDRPAALGRALHSVLAGRWQDFELLVLDQSATAATQQAVTAAAAGDRRVRYRRVPPCGKAIALNSGIMLARGALLAFLDDDCEAPPTWLERLVQAFTADPRLMLLVGAVVGGPHDPARGFIPTFTPTRRLYGLGVLTCGDNPMGANMAMRRALPHAIGLFDPLLGAGAPLRSSYDIAYCYRAYRLGRRICADPTITVVHHGFRSWTEGRRLVQGYALGTAAAYTKFVRLGDPLALALLAADLSRYSLRMMRQLLRRQRPVHLTALRYRLLGIVQSFRYAVDHKTLLYVPRQPKEAVAGAGDPVARPRPAPAHVRTLIMGTKREETLRQGRRAGGSRLLSRAGDLRAYSRIAVNFLANLQ
jgi:glycosyltransferase involved in cell wall biosynthesis